MISNTVFNMNPYYSRFIDVYEENKQRCNEINEGSPEYTIPKEQGAYSMIDIIELSHKE